MKRYSHFFVAFLLLICISATGQQSAFEPVKIQLNNLDAFEAGKNWSVASDVFYDFTGKEKTKITDGSGVLVNVITAQDKSHLFTKMVHGDIELELDFMMAPNSNAGVYLQGRYEIQMFDSWAIKTPKSTDCGAIYERWDEDRPEGKKGYEGHPPIQNVSKAPGLWQHLKIIFQAPRFNSNGVKTENARFLIVELNGVVIHENVAVSGPTRAAYFSDEKPLGPLMIQGDHGPVAIRNIQYRLYGTESIRLSDLGRITVDGTYRSVDEVTRSFTANEKVEPIAFLGPGNPETLRHFGGRIQGKAHIPKKGKYFLKVDLGWIPPETDPLHPNGGAALQIDEQEIISIDGKHGGNAGVITELDSGEHSFSLVYYKTYDLWYAPSDYIEFGFESAQHPFKLLNSVPRSAEAPGAIVPIIKDQPMSQRCFLLYNGKKKTHVIAVGYPEKVNYAYDLSKGTLLQWWRGDFIETTLMWFERGEQQIAVPLGSMITKGDEPDIAILRDTNEAWPDSSTHYNFNGYEIRNGNPTIKYTLGDLSIEETIRSATGGKGLVRSIAIANAKGNAWCRIASGAQVAKLSKNTYAVDDKKYYLNVSESDELVIRKSKKGQEILIRPNTKSKDKIQTIQYSIIW